MVTWEVSCVEIKAISIIALDPRAARSYGRDVEGLFGEVADVSVFSVMDGSAMGMLPHADLFAASPDAFGSPEELARHVPIDSQTMAVQASFRWQELRRLKRYYEQLDSIFDELAENDNSLLGKQNTRRFANLGNRMERYLNAVQSLRESVAQLREAYQSQLSIQQNDLMKIFTVVTAVFLPLTLLVGWYGMNFVGMPELHWKYGYPAVILVSVGIVAALVIYFKKKKWL